MTDIKPQSLLEKPVPFVTLFCLAWCTIVFVAMHAIPDLGWDLSAKFGYFPNDVVVSGAWWALITHAFVHIDFIHFLFNMYWLFLLGPVLEREFGSAKTAAFVLLSALVSSGFELASGQIGIGFSGVGYAMVGFGWVARQYRTNLEAAFNDRTVQLFGVWFFICIAGTALKMMNVANIAHGMGAVFGVVCGYAFLRPSLLAKVGAVALILTSIVPVYWNPLSYDWQAIRGYDLLTKEKYEQSLPFLNRARQLASTKEQEQYAIECIITSHAELDRKEDYKSALEALRAINEMKAKDFTELYGDPLGVFKK